MKRTSFYNAAQLKWNVTGSLQTFTPILLQKVAGRMPHQPHRVRRPCDVAELIIRSHDVCVTEVALLLSCIFPVGWENGIRPEISSRMIVVTHCMYVSGW